jgi:hypothetical protein
VRTPPLRDYPQAAVAHASAHIQPQRSRQGELDELDPRPSPGDRRNLFGGERETGDSQLQAEGILTGPVRSYHARIIGVRYGRLFFGLPLLDTLMTRSSHRADALG